METLAPQLGLDETEDCVIVVLIVQRVDNYVQWINRYSVDKIFSNPYILCSGKRFIHWIELSTLSTTGAWSPFLESPGNLPGPIQARSKAKTTEGA